MPKNKKTTQNKKEINNANNTNNETEEHYTIDYEEIEPERIDRIIEKIKMGENLSFFE